jgi:hypothetical protein
MAIRKSARKKTSVNYVDNEKFYNAIVAHRNKVVESDVNKTEYPRIPDYIGECIWKIAENLSMSPSFIGYSFREEMVSDGVENCILYFYDFDPTVGTKPFSYFTTVIYYAFLRRIYKEEKHRYTNYKLFQESVGLEGHLLVDSDDKQLMPGTLYDNINDFMGEFERKESEKKAKRKATKEGLSKFYED